MKKIYAVNGSPRRNCNTATVLGEALRGAEANGAETGLIHLIDLDFSGCLSCFECKLRDGKHYGKCALRDGLTPVLNKLTTGDGLILGTPVYFGAESGLMRNFLERLLFPFLRYDVDHSTLAPKSFPVFFVYTMNVTESQLRECGYQEKFRQVQRRAGATFGCEPEALYVCDTFQFDDYTRYDAPLFDPEHKASVRRERFPPDCRRAFELGRRMAAK